LPWCRWRSRSSLPRRYLDHHNLCDRAPLRRPHCPDHRVLLARITRHVGGATWRNPGQQMAGEDRCQHRHAYHGAPACRRRGGDLYERASRPAAWPSIAGTIASGFRQDPWHDVLHKTAVLRNLPRHCSTQSVVTSGPIVRIACAMYPRSLSLSTVEHVITCLSQGGRSCNTNELGARITAVNVKPQSQPFLDEGGCDAVRVPPARSRRSIFFAHLSLERRLLRRETGRTAYA
jgi:hypothetical protein